MKIDAQHVAVEREFGTVMEDAFSIHAGVDAEVTEEIDRALFEHAGADAAEHVVGALAFEDHRVDPGFFQKPAERQAGRAGADDRNLRAHDFPPHTGRSIAGFAGRMGIAPQLANGQAQQRVGL